MKILWVTNQIFPEISKELGMDSSKTGGWMFALAEGLKTHNNLELIICSVANIKAIVEKKIDGIQYFVLPSKLPTQYYDKKLSPIWAKFINQITPDIVHIHGTENAHGLVLVDTCPNLIYVTSIQGIISECAKFYHQGISSKEIFYNLTLRDIVRMDTIWQAKRKFVKRGINELRFLKKINNVIGRTDWDYSLTQKINPLRNYHFCNENLRSEFYNSKKWNFEYIEPHTIFMSQGYYPLKGLHEVVKSISLVKKKYPKVKLKIAGGDIISKKTLKERLKFSGYGKFLTKLIKQYQLEDNIQFIGSLDTKGMIENYLKCQLFISASSIENSSNSIGEAQILGTPTIASFVGGNFNMISHESTGFLYRFEAAHMSAHFICKIFEDNILSNQISINSIKIAQERHDSSVNINKLLDIYKSLLN